MVTRTVIRVTSTEAAATEKRGDLGNNIHPTCEQSDTDGVTNNEHLCDGSSTHGNCNDNRGEKKRALPSPSAVDSPLKKRRRADAFVIDLTGIPQQQPIRRNEWQMKEGATKYVGIYFDGTRNKWRARMKIEGKPRFIGTYENEEEAAIDYARAVFKYKGQAALDKMRETNLSLPRPIDLSGVCPQPPIPKMKGHIKEGASKYIGIYFHKSMSKWYAQIMIKGNHRFIGYYENEEEAAVDYARALFKYKGQEALNKAREQNSFGSGPAIDLKGVPPQPLIPKSVSYIREGASKYAGVTWDKSKNKWRATIKIEGKSRYIGYYINEEEAAVDYARAVFKYKGQER